MKTYLAAFSAPTVDTSFANGQRWLPSLYCLYGQGNSQQVMCDRYEWDPASGKSWWRDQPADTHSLYDLVGGHDLFSNDGTGNLLDAGKPIDAALCLGNTNTVYLFQGGSCIALSINRPTGTQQNTQGYAQSIAQVFGYLFDNEKEKAFPFDGVDAALYSAADNKVWFFRGTQCESFDGDNYQPDHWDPANDNGGWGNYEPEIGSTWADIPADFVRLGHTEAAVDLARLAGLRPAGAIVEIAGEDGVMLRLPELIPFARKHGLTIISIEDLIAYRRSAEPTVRREAEVSLPTSFGQFTAYGYRSTVDGVEHVALVHGEIGDGEEVLVRMHSECLTGDIFQSQRCDCGPQLHAAMERVQAAGRGVIVYLRGHEGRGIGLLSKLRAYELQERGRDTLDANLELGLPADARDYAAGAQMLADLGVHSVRLLTNNPDKAEALVRGGIKVSDREPMPMEAGEHNLRYLRTKRDRMGHDLPWLGMPTP